MAKIYEFRRKEGGRMPVSVLDVAKAFLSIESMTHKKLQKLCYYAQAWHLALYNRRLIKEQFEAWIHGPVCPELYAEYKNYGWETIPKEQVLPENITDEIMEFINIVYSTYGGFDGDELEALTHLELPWREARKGLEEWEPSNNIISEETMKRYYKYIYEKSQND